MAADEQSIFFEAMDLGPEEVPAFLARACGDNSALYHRVRALLNSHHESPEYLERPAVEAGQWTLDMVRAPEVAEPAVEALAIVPKVDGYQITGRLGQGGMGVVWRAVQHGTQRPVALKMLTVAGFGSNRARLRFQREVELTANLEHPHIARVYEGGASHGHVYYVMELIDGLPLDRYAREAGLSRRAIVELMATLCRAVQHAHQRGVIHRDLKPANILIDKTGQPHVLDFGLARAIQGDANSEISLDGELAGTPNYMSPEQAAGKRNTLDTRSDVYTLGVLLFYLLSGRFPHDSEGTSWQVIRRIAEGEPQNLTHAESGGDRELEAVLSKALAREPEQRYSTAGELADDLSRYLKGEPLNARPQTIGYLLQKRFRRYRAMLGLFAGVVALLLGTAAWAYARVKAERDSAVVSERNALAAKQVAVETDAAREVQRQAAEAAKILAEANAKRAEVRRVEGMAGQASTLGALGRWAQSKAVYEQAYAESVALGMPTTSIDAGMSDAFAHAPPALLTLRGHVGRVNAIALLPDARTAISAGRDQTLKVWDLISGRCLHTLNGHIATVNCVAVSPGGQLAVSGSHDRTIRLWDVSSGEQLQMLGNGESGVLAIAFSPDGRTILSGGEDKILRLWDVESGSLLKAMIGHDQPILSLAFSPDGRTAISGSQDRYVRQWDLATGKLIDKWTGRNESQVGALAFSKDGSAVLSMSSVRRLQLWDITGKRELQFLGGHESGISAVRTLSGGRTAITASSDKTVRLWSLQSGLVIRTFTGHTDAVTDVAVSGGGRLAVSCSADGTIKTWTLEDPMEQQPFGDNSSSHGVLAASPDGRTLLEARLEALRLWDIATGKVLRNVTLKDHAPERAAFSPNGREVIVASKSDLFLLHMDTGKIIRTFPGHSGSIKAVRFLPDGASIVSVGVDSRVRVWDVASGVCTSDLMGSGQPIYDVAISPDGRFAITGGARAELSLWALNTGELLHSFSAEEGAIYAVAFSIDGRFVFSSHGDGTVCSWEVPSLALKHRFIAHAGRAFTVATSPDGQLLATGGEDHTLRLWNLSTGNELHSADYNANVETVTFVGDGRLVAAATSASVRLWNPTRLARYRELQPRVEAAVRTLATSADDPASLAVLGEWYSLRGMTFWAAKLLERARAGGIVVSPLMLGRAEWGWGHADEAIHEFQTVLAASHDEVEKRYLRMCLEAIAHPPPPR